MTATGDNGEQTFQSTLPRRERLVRRKNFGEIAEVSIHAPTKGATIPITVTVTADTVSIHAPTKGATSLMGIILISRSRFNPRSHEGSDYDYQDYINSFAVSIHAPTKGATIYSSNIPVTALFQSTLPRRERPYESINPCNSPEVSIHAPTKGATK